MNYEQVKAKIESYEEDRTKLKKALNKAESVEDMELLYTALKVNFNELEKLEAYAHGLRILEKHLETGNAWGKDITGYAHAIIIPTDLPILLKHFDELIIYGEPELVNVIAVMHKLQA